MHIHVFPEMHIRYIRPDTGRIELNDYQAEESLNKIARFVNYVTILFRVRKQSQPRTMVKGHKRAGS